jgi:hypothetical protein
MNATTRTPAIDATTDTNALTVTLAFSNGETLTIDATQLTTDIQAQATLHGLKQKLVDAAAISRNPDTGRSATINDKYNAVREVYDRLLLGQWNKNRDAGAVRGGLLFRALCMLYPDKTGDAIKAFLEKKTAAEKTALRNTPKIADIILTLKDDEAGDDVDTDAMLDELN